MSERTVQELRHELLRPLESARGEDHTLACEDRALFGLNPDYASLFDDGLLGSDLEQRLDAAIEDRFQQATDERAAVAHQPLGETLPEQLVGESLRLREHAPISRFGNRHRGHAE